jgi:hypothetical protein
MVMMSTQAKVVFERLLAAKGWAVTRRRQVEIRDSIHDTIISMTDQDITLKTIIAEVQENHTLMEQGILKQGDAIASFISTADISKDDRIIDPVTGKQYEVAKLWQAAGEGGVLIAKKVALKWVNR